MQNGSVLPAKNGLITIIRDPRERTRFLKFAAVGAMGAVVDFVAFNLFVSVAHLPALWASLLSFVLAVISNFLWNRYWTYPDSRSKNLAKQVSQFFIVSAVGMGIRAILFLILENTLIKLAAGILPATFPVTATFVGHNTTLAIAIVIVMLWNFFANRFWTYNDVK